MTSYRSLQQSNATRSQQSVYSRSSQRVITMSTGSEYGGGLVMSREDQRLAVQVEQQHSSNGPQLNTVRSLFNHAIFMFKGAGVLTGSEGGMEAKAAKLETMLAPNITQMIRLVLCEMGCKCPGGGSERDIQSSMLAVVGALRNCEWEEKMVITLAVFAVKLGEFLKIPNMYSGDSLADSMALLKQLPAKEAYDDLRKELSDIIILMLQVTDQVMSFTAHLTSLSTYVSADHPSIEAVLNTLPIAACWIVMSTVTAATHISMVATSTTKNPSATATTTPQLSKCSEKLKQILKYLQEKTQFVVRKQEKEAYKKLRTTFYEAVSQDITIAIKTLICSNINDDSPPLCDASNKKVQLDVLQEQTVLLLITGKDHNLPELDMLENIYGVLEKKQCRIVWVPVLEGSSSSITWSSTSETTGRPRPWYCVANPSEINPAVIRLFKEDLAFKGHPTLVCLKDTREGFRSMNVLHLLTIWKQAAIPFTVTRVVELWNKQSLTFKLLVDDMVDQASNWVEEEKYIVVYGGEIDGNWIRNFKKAIKEFADATGKAHECVYVGKSCMQGVHKLSDKSFGHFLKEDKVRVFWTRLESMLYTKIELDMEDDLVTRGIKKIVSYDKSKASWAVICKGDKVINVVSGTTILEVFKYDKWKHQVTEDREFESVLEIQIDDVGSRERHCVRLEFRDAAGTIPQTMKCHGCSEEMQKLTVFSCCRDAPEDDTAAPNGHDESTDYFEEINTSESTKTISKASLSRQIVNE